MTTPTASTPTVRSDDIQTDFLQAREHVVAATAIRITRRHNVFFQRLIRGALRKRRNRQHHILVHFAICAEIGASAATQPRRQPHRDTIAGYRPQQLIAGDHPPATTPAATFDKCPLVVVRGGAVHPVLVERLVFAGEHGLARLAHKVDQEMQVVNRQ